MKFGIPCKITEYCTVTVDAANQREALVKFRQRDWVECGDNDTRRTEVKKAGPIQMESER